MKKQTEYFKRIVNILLLNGVGWVWCSYLLAYLGREQIAETLSNNAVDSVIAVVLAYAIKSLCENTLKYNDFIHKKTKASESDAEGDTYHE